MDYIVQNILIQISEKLKNSKKKGLSIGGIHSTTNNEPIRDENGKFTVEFKSGTMAEV